MEKLILILLLGIESIVDIRERKILVILPGIYILAMVTFQLWCKGMQWEEIMILLVVGILLYGTSVMTREAIGKGDVWLIEMVIVSMQWEQAFFCVLVSFFLAALFSIGYFVFSKRRKKNISFPFAPFLCIGTMVAVGLEMGVVE